MAPISASGRPSKVELFHRLHHQDRPLVLPNAWDYASAAALAEAGFPAIGTTSLGVAAAAGLPDGAGRTRAETIQLAQRLASLSVPVTVDIEAGFSTDPDQVADLAETLTAAGIAGVNLEDGRGTALAEPATQAELIAAVKSRAPALFVNARIDTYWLGREHDSTLPRAERYQQAGADGIFVPGLRDPDDIRRVVSAVAAPLNVLFHPDGLTVTQLAALGVRRISTGSLLFRAALAATLDTARAIRDDLSTASGVPSYGEVVELIERSSDGSGYGGPR